MSDVTPNLKPFGPCPCLCGVESTYKRAFKDGVQHVRGCGCRRCTGRRSKSTGGKAQRRASKLLAVPKSSSIRTGHEEHAGGEVRFEVKSGAQVRPIVTAHTKAEAQSEAARAIGDNRPTVVCSLLHPEGKEMIVSFRVRTDEDMRVAVAALARQLGVV